MTIKKRVDVHSQAELDAVVAAGDIAVVRCTEWVEAWESAHVVAMGSAHVVARESAHVVAMGSAHVEARGSAHVEAGSHVSVHVQSPRAVVEGGVQIAAPVFTTPSDWLAYCGVKHDGKTALLYKGVSDDYKSPRGGDYTPGTIPEALDWDGGKAECGGGLHFCARPLDTLQFHADATRFIACPVALSDMSIPPTPEDPRKIKARGCCAPVYEVDRFGKRVEVPA